jgi:NAD(P)-dependent dehydrogenase (short-subunit alcohol dehydrogenase family)
MNNILITGANRGIGFALTRLYSEHDDTTVFAACRRPHDAPELRSLAGEPGRSVEIIRLDVNDPSSIDHCSGDLRDRIDSIDMLINNAGIFGGSVADPMPQTSQFGSLAMDAMLEVFRTNSVAPVLVAQACSDLLRKGVLPRIVNVSSDAGSITLQSNKGNYTYMASKAALNMMTRCLAGELREYNIIVVSVHPGFLQTGIGCPGATMRVEEAVPSLVQQIDRLSMGDSGRFINWDGGEIPW